MFRFLLFISLLFTACGTANQCDARSCANGCCDSLGQCRTGGDRSTCGLGGDLCTTCDLSQVCSVGRCQSSISGSGGGSSGVGGGSTAGGTVAGGSAVGGGNAAGGNVAGGTVTAGGTAGGRPVGGGSTAGGVAGGRPNGGGSSGGGIPGVGGGTPNVGGGTSGTGGGAPAGCTTFTQSFVTNTGSYSNVSGLDEQTVVIRRTATSGFFTQFEAYVIWGRQGAPTNAVVPGTFDLSQGTRNTCSGCLVLRECSLSTGCSRSFLARAGTFSVQMATRATPGSFVATAQHVKFEEWVLGSDAPVSGGACIYLPSASISASF